jgi:hypothetical protein
MEEYRWDRGVHCICVCAFGCIATRGRGEGKLRSLSSETDVMDEEQAKRKQCREHYCVGVALPSRSMALS